MTTETIDRCIEGLRQAIKELKPQPRVKAIIIGVMNELEALKPFRCSELEAAKFQHAYSKLECDINKLKAKF